MMLKRTTRELAAIYGRFFSSMEPVQRAYVESIHALVSLAESRDPYTRLHSMKTTEYAAGLAMHMKLSDKEIKDIKVAALLHDIGKLGIKQEILTKPSSLTAGEFREIKKHPKIAVEIIKPLKFFKGVISAIKHHHENYDGRGYPDGLKGENISVGARILSVADVYDALTSRRSYRKAYSSVEALRIMKNESGKKFDPDILKSFKEYISLQNKKIYAGKTNN